MENILLLDTSVSSLNKGDEIIMNCVQSELEFITKGNFALNVPTHLSPFHSYQVWRNSRRVNVYKNSKYKFVGGSNLLVPNMLTHFPQWNLNIFNYKGVKDCILVGVGKGAGEKTNGYTTSLYKKLLNRDYFHSVRDERSKNFLESLGIKAINTGCVTMWALTPEFCRMIPSKKATQVVFTLTASKNKDDRDQKLIDILIKNYSKVYYWVQGHEDFEYLQNFNNINEISIINPTVKDFKDVLELEDIEYIGTRLHAGVYAMRHRKRAIIIAIDERARGINERNNLNCIEKDNIEQLPKLINSSITTNIKMPLEEIKKWRAQFL
ncbi:polysaccharide pyruvyl transferase family protein [Paenisporosarcina antarctica]|uniref:Polysaccharide pyruvyl transferase family protein n=1 Tax=Paenisporosarcina antarctica TaxID=417367 RepID=A0A4P7A0B0_9BACL|nr:polysaccharide pyruvyl transferase family protein [Paenisporosarcina antarctica]QBP42008.1 polysaccharide pyruvyl transferase family protein [Paenisporosarcina antarctica]